MTSMSSDEHRTTDLPPFTAAPTLDFECSTCGVKGDAPGAHAYVSPTSDCGGTFRVAGLYPPAPQPLEPKWSPSLPPPVYRPQSYDAPVAPAPLRLTDPERADAELTTMLLAVHETGGIERWCEQLPPSTMAFALAAILRHHVKVAR